MAKLKRLLSAMLSATILLGGIAMTVPNTAYAAEKNTLTSLISSIMTETTLVLTIPKKKLLSRYGHQVQKGIP